MQKLFSYLFAFGFLTAAAQEVGAWGDLYSYNRVNDIVKLSGEEYLCAAGRALFKFDYENVEVSKFSKANGLSDIDIAAIERDPVSGITVIGYENANIDLLIGDRIFNMPDIIQSLNYSGRKRINEIVIRNGRAYLAMGFGVVEVDLEERLILDTWILGPNATEMEVFDLTFDEAKDTVWAMTEGGVYRAYLQDELFYYENWEGDPGFTAPPGKHIQIFEGKLFASSELGNQDSMYVRSQGVWTASPYTSLGSIHQLQVIDGRFMSSSSFAAEERDANGETIQFISAGYGGNAGYQPLFAMRNSVGHWFTGDAKRGLIFIDNPNYIRRAVPLSPPSNQVAGVYVSGEKLFIASGAVTGIWAPTYNFEGFYALEDMAWRHYRDERTDTAHDVIQILEDPMDETRFFVAAFGTGILEYRNGELFQRWDASNTDDALKGTLNDNDVRTGGMAFDANGVLWVTSSESESSLASYDREGNWESHSIGTFNGADLKNIRILSNGDFWLQGRNDGLYALRMEDGTTSTRRLGTGEGNGDLSSLFIHDFEEDLDGEVWIGTGEGVMVHFAPDNLFIQGRNFDASNILILENGVYQRLLGSEGVLAVEVDGGNRKWFGTETGGVFLTSEDGKEEIHHFTKENSPLPSNRILDVEVDPGTGVVYIATDVGIVTFNGDATAGNVTMEEVMVYPNPVRPGYTGPIAIRGLVNDAQVKITDVSGNIVFETRSNGGQAVWYGDDLSGNRVSTGVYLAYITDELGENTAVAKILLVNGN